MKKFYKLSLFGILSFFIGANLLADASKPLTFEEALKLATSNTTTANRDALTLEAAKSQTDRSNQLYFPEITADASHGRYLYSGDLESSTQRQAEVSANLNLYRFGADMAQKDLLMAQGQLVESSVAQERLAREQLAAKTVLNAVGSGQDLELQARFLTLRRNSVDLARRLFEKGSRPAQDVEKLAIDLAQEEMQFQTLKLAHANNLGRLRLLARADIDLQTAWPWETLLRSENVKKLLITAPVKQPKRALTLQKQQVALAKLSSTRSRLLPSFDLGGKYGAVQNVDFDQFSRQWSAVLTLTVPIYNRGSDFADYREAEANYRLAAIDLEDLDSETQSQVAAAQRSFSTSIEGVKAKEDVVKRAKALFDTTLQGFQRGVVSANDLATDETRYLMIQKSLLTAWLDAHQAFVDLCGVLGMELRECSSRVQ